MTAPPSLDYLWEIRCAMWEQGEWLKTEGTTRGNTRLFVLGIQVQLDSDRLWKDMLEAVYGEIPFEWELVKETGECRCLVDFGTHTKVFEP